jgi:hypothetical protein
MHAMDENPYAPHFVPCGRHKLESVQFVRLQAAMSKCKPQPLQAADAEGIAKKIHWAVTRLNSRTQLESVERAKDEVRRAREIKSHATKLARLLSKQDGSLAASLESYFDRLPPERGPPNEDDDDDNKRALRKRLTSPFELRPALYQLAQAAEQYTRGPRAGLPAIPKVTGHSPMQRFILEIAPLFEALTGLDAKVDRINADGHKGGDFTDFIRAVGGQWQFDPPSAEAIAQALRK